MVAPLVIVFVVALVVWALAGSWARPLSLLAVGAALFGPLVLMGRLRIAWPDLPMPLAILLNPYLLLSLGMSLMIGGGVAVAVRGVRVAIAHGRRVAR